MTISPHSDLDYRPLFGSLEPSNIIRLFNALIMEEKILVISADLSLLFPVLEASLELISPLEWPHPYFPIAPVNMLEDFDEWLKFPGAFYFGAQKKAINWPHVDIPKEVIVVDLDQNRVMRSKGGNNDGNGGKEESHERERESDRGDALHSTVPSVAVGVVGKATAFAGVTSVTSQNEEPQWEMNYEESGLNLGHPHLPSRYTFKIYQTLAKVGGPIFLSQNGRHEFEAPPMSPLATPAEHIIAQEVSVVHWWN